jgi:hypothetical protein
LPFRWWGWGCEDDDEGEKAVDEDGIIMRRKRADSDDFVVSSDDAHR